MEGTSILAGPYTYDALSFHSGLTSWMSGWKSIPCVYSMLHYFRSKYYIQYSTYLQYVYVLYREALLPERGVRSGERDEGRAVGHVSIA